MTPTEKSPLVVFVILNWKNADDTLACLETLRKTTYNRFEVVIVENGSHDDSFERISSWKSPYPLHILSQDENLGFAGGVNQGMRYGMSHNADFVFLLNNDAHTASDMLIKMVASAQKHQNVGIFGPVIYRIADGVATDWVWFASGMLNWFDIARIGKHGTIVPQPLNDSVPTSFITGCAMLIRRKVIESIGEFDERFFLYFEDVDYNVRAKKAGWEITVVPEAKAWHKVSATTLPRVGASAILYYHHRNGMLLAHKYAPIFIKIYMHVWACSKIVKQTTKLFAQKDALIARAIVRGIRDYYRGKFGKYAQNRH